MDATVKDPLPYTPKFKEGDKIVFKLSSTKEAYYYTILRVETNVPPIYYRMAYTVGDGTSKNSIPADFFDKNAALVGSPEATWLIL